MAINNAINAPLPLSPQQGGTGLSNPALGFLVSNGPNTPMSVSNLNNGQLLIGSTGAPPVPATLTAGEGINITNTPGSITIEATGGGGSATLVHVTQVTGNYTALPTDQFLSVNTSTAPITITLPNVPLTGQTYTIVDNAWNAAINPILVPSNSVIYPQYLNQITSNISRPYGVAISNTYMYVANFNANSISIFSNPSSGVPIFISYAGNVSNPRGIAISGNCMYVSSNNASSISIFSLQAFSIVTNGGSLQLTYDGNQWLSTV